MWTFLWSIFRNDGAVINWPPGTDTSYYIKGLRNFRKKLKLWYLTFIKLSDLLPTVKSGNIITEQSIILSQQLKIFGRALLGCF